MTKAEEQEIITLVRENNALLRIIISQITQGNSDDFIKNIIANLVASKFEIKK